MPRLIDQALESFRSNDPEILADGVRLAVSFIEHAHGRAGEWLDHPDVVNEPATPADLERLRDGLTELVRARPRTDVASSAVFALGKFHDPGLTNFFVQVLREHQHGDAGVLYQAMIALDNLGANVFAGRPSMSILDEHENRVLAADFVRRADERGR